MYRQVLKSKIHRARVTDTNKAYEGSITIDDALLEVAALSTYERVQVVNVMTGERFETYAIPGNAGEICLNGAAARLAEPGDVVIIMAYGLVKDPDAVVPSIVKVNETNAVVE